MSESRQDIERRTRLHEWFKSEPAIWQDIKDEIEISLHNENVRLKSKVTESREWSAGWVCSHEFILTMERYFTKQWNPPIMQGKQEVPTSV